MSFSIKVDIIKEPPQKVLLMYQAVSSLLKEKEVSRITVSDITSTAGIGKGTAYEYFSSKEEIISSALLYEYGQKLQELVTSVFEVKGFKNRYFRLLDWISDTKEYNQMFFRTLQNSVGDEIDCKGMQCMISKEIGQEFSMFMRTVIGRFFEEGVAENVFKEPDNEKRIFALISAVVGYSFVDMTSPIFCGYDTTSLKEVSYEQLIKALS